MTPNPTPRRYAVAGLARLISLIATVVFIIFAILGLNFYNGGQLMTTAVVGITASIVLSRALITMCRCKAARQGSRRRRERRALATALAIMAVGTLFVSKFISIARHHDEMRSAMSETVATLRLLDRDYHTYADTRIARAPQRLRSTLTILLYPQDEAKIWEARRNWLDSLKDDDVWNVFMPSNVRALNDAAQRWAAEYADISAVILRDEPQDCAPFAPSASTTRLADITAESRRITMPDTAGAAASAMLAGLMMLCYIATRRPTSDAEGTHR